MAIVTVPRLHYPPRWMERSAIMALTTGLTLDAADERAGLILRAGRTGNVTHIRWGTRTVTTGAALDVRLETVDTSVLPPVPSGTLWGTNTNGAQVVLATDDNVQFETALIAGAAVTINDLLAVAIVNPSALFGNMVITSLSNVIAPADVFATLFTTAWAISTRFPNIALKYDDGLYYPIEYVFPFSAATTSTYNNGSTPDVRGLRFTLPSSLRICGAWFMADLDGAADLKLYDSDGVTVLRSASFLANARASNTQWFYEALWSSGVTLAGSTVYRLGLEPSSVTDVILPDFSCASVDVMAAMPGGAEHYYTSAKDPSGTGSWTDVTTRWPVMGLIVDGVDAGGGGSIEVSTILAQVSDRSRAVAY